VEYRLLVLVLEQSMNDEWQFGVSITNDRSRNILDDDSDSCSGLPISYGHGGIYETYLDTLLDTVALNSPLCALVILELEDFGVVDWKVLIWIPWRCPE
jgi:hypothetical protein